MPITEDRVGKLREFGLSEYAARAYLALLDLGVTEARDISKLTKVPTSKIYHILDQLHERGLVQILPEFPKKYAPIPFQEYLDKLERSHREAATAIQRDRDRLTNLFTVRGNVDIGDRGTFTVVRGRRNVVERIEEMLDGAQSEVFLLATAGFAHRWPHFRERIARAAERGVRFRLLAPVTAETVDLLHEAADTHAVRARPADAETEHGSVAIAIADGARAFLVNHVPDDASVYTGRDVGMYTDQEALVATLRSIVEREWEASPPYAVRREELATGRRPETTRFLTSREAVARELQEALRRGGRDICAVDTAADGRGVADLALLPSSAEARVLLNVESAALADKLASARDPSQELRHLPSGAFLRFWVVDDREAFLSMAPAAAGDAELVIHTTGVEAVRSLRAQFDALWARGLGLEERARELRLFPHVQPRDLGIGRLFDAVRDAIVVADAEGRIVLWNAASEALFGHTAAEALAMRVDDLVPEEARAAGGMDRFRAGPDSAERGPFEIAALRKDGTRVLVQLSLNPILDAPDGPYTLAIIRDVTQERRAADALRDEKDLLERILRGSQDGIAAFDRELRYTVWNPSMERISGVAAAGALGRPALEVFPFLADTGEDAHFRRALAGEVVEAHDRPYLVPETGRRGFFDAHYAPLRDGAGRVVGGLAVVRDVTERRRMEERLRESEALYRLIADNSSDMIGIYTPDGKCLYVSPACRRVTGHEPADLMGSNAFDRVHPDDAADVRGGVKRLLEAGEHTFTYRARHADGAWRWHETVARVVGEPSGAVRELLAVTRDVTARKEAEDALRAGEERFRLLAEHAHDVIAIVDEDGRLEYVSPGIERVLGIPEAAYRASSWNAFVHPDDRPLVERSARQLRDTGSSQVCLRVRRADGRWAWIETNASAVVRDGGRRVYVSVARDVTARVEVEEAVRRREELHRKVLRLQGRLGEGYVVVEGTRIVDASEAYCRLTGYELDELRALPESSVLVAPEAREAAVALVRQRLGGVLPRHAFETVLLHKSGRRIEVEVVLEYERDGDATRAIALVRDVSERRALERLLRGEAQRLFESLGRGSGPAPPTVDALRFALECARHLTRASGGVLLADEDGRLVVRARDGDVVDAEAAAPLAAAARAAGRAVVAEAGADPGPPPGAGCALAVPLEGAALVLFAPAGQLFGPEDGDRAAVVAGLVREALARPSEAAGVPVARAVEPAGPGAKPPARRRT